MSEVPKEEFAARLEKLRGLIRSADIDALIVSDKASIYYLTGAVYEPLERPFFIVVDGQEKCDLIAPLLEQRHMRKVPGWFTIHAYREFPAPAGQGWSEKLEEVLGDRALRIGIEPSTPSAIARAIRDGRSEICDFIERLRLVKSPLEVRLLRRSAGYAVKAVQALLDNAGYGKTIADGYAAKRALMAQLISSLPYWEAVTTDILMVAWAAPRSADPHSIPSLDDVMKEGPHVALVLSRINGYATECERTFFVSPPTPDDRDLFAIMQEARKIAFAMVRPGVRCAEIDAAVTDYLKSRGHGAHLLHRTGHGFGLGAHEGPWVAEGGEDVLQENMLISIEPGIYIPDHGGVRHSDTVLVTADGYEVLTPMPTSIEAMSLGAASS